MSKTQSLIDTAKLLVADNKGLLAMDESIQTCNKRFAEHAIAQTDEKRRAYRELIITTPQLGDCISGLILSDETIRQTIRDATPMADAVIHRAMIPGIKVDKSTHDLAGYPGEKVTEGLDELRSRLQGYAKMGARFAKWRAVFSIGYAIPSRACIEANTHALARYAALCQECGLVPIVEPEVLMDGNHSLADCSRVSEQVLRALFEELYTQKVMLEGLLLKPNMVLSGLESLEHKTTDDIADTTVACLLRAVPAAVPGVVFLSGGQSPELASARLNAMNAHFKISAPWAIAFSFARAIQQPALELWKGDDDNWFTAQLALYHRARCNRAARLGQYSAEMERGMTAIQKSV
jgi:fructose-bisphosphate aldolase class I